MKLRSSFRRLFALETAETGDRESETDRMSGGWSHARDHRTQPKGKDGVA